MNKNTINCIKQAIYSQFINIYAKILDKMQNLWYYSVCKGVETYETKLFTNQKTESVCGSLNRGFNINAREFFIELRFYEGSIRTLFFIIKIKARLFALLYFMFLNICAMTSTVQAFPMHLYLCVLLTPSHKV